MVLLSTKFLLLTRKSISSENISGIDFILYVVEGGVVAVGDDGAGKTLKLLQVVHDAAAEESLAILKSRLIDDHRRTLRLDAFHHALDRALAEIIRIALHGQAVHTDDDLFLLRARPTVVGLIRSRKLQHALGNIVFPRAVALHDRLDEVLGHILVVCKQLFGVLGEAIAAVAEARIVVMRPDARIEAYAVDDLPSIQPLHLRIGIELVEEAHAKSEICIREQFHCLRLREAHEERVDVLFDRPLLQKPCKRIRSFHEARILHIRAHDDTGGIEVIVERLALAQKLRAEDDVLAARFLSDGLCIAHGDGAFDDHDRLGIDLHHERDDGLHRRGIEEILLAVVVGGRGDDDDLCLGIGIAAVERGRKVEILFGEVFLDVLVLDGRLTLIDEVHLFRHDVDGIDLIVLGKQRSNGQPHIPRTRHRDRVLMFHNVSPYFRLP